MVKSQTQKKILLLHTGGTIGMGMDKIHAPLSPDHRFSKTLRKNLPELWKLAHVEIQAVSNKDSSQITSKDWTQLATKIIECNDDYDAFVVTHGTDTMVYTGCALSYLLPYPCKPVILTGSQRPLQAVLTDAQRNLISSVEMAASQWICEVMLFFDTLLLRANRSKKVHIEEFQTFDSPNFPRLAEERLRTRYYRPARESLNRPTLEPKFDSRIQVVKAFPGAHIDLIPNSRAVVVEAFGCGNLPIPIFDLLKKCARKKIPVVLTSQVFAGGLAPEIYEMGRKALDLGAISALDMTFEAALVKCMMLAGNKVAYADWPAGMMSNWAGELTPRQV